MNDINKIQIIHDVKENFSVTEEHLNHLINQLENDEHKNNLERFFQGYKKEDLYSFIYASLPWAKLIHGLQQNQLPKESKENYQVPDYLCIFENSNKKDCPILVEVKSVKGDKKSLELMKKQVNVLQNYKDCTDIQLLFVVYWEKYGLWTHVPLDMFEEKNKKYKLTLENAFKADISIIFGDISFLITQPIYRKTEYIKNAQNNPACPQHSKYGTVIADFLSLDDINYFKLESYEAPVIDAIIDMGIISEQEIDGKTITIEKSNGDYCIKLSNWIMRYLRITHAMDQPLDYKKFLLSRIFIVELMKKLKVKISYQIPSIASKQTSNLYRLAFEGTSVYDNFVSYHES